MYIGILKTYYEVYAIGKTKDEVKENIIKGYKALYPINDRQFENPSFDDLNDYFGCRIAKIDSNGYAHE